MVGISLGRAAAWAMWPHLCWQNRAWNTTSNAPCDCTWRNRTSCTPHRTVASELRIFAFEI
jgi:hypothetical protein